MMLTVQHLLGRLAGLMRPGHYLKSLRPDCETLLPALDLRLLWKCVRLMSSSRLPSASGA
jgi:hypothetical protein